VKSVLIIIPAPGTDPLLGVLDRLEPMCVEALLADLPLKNSTMALFVGLPRRLKSSPPENSEPLSQGVRWVIHDHI
jgi:hypothetical protein